MALTTLVPAASRAAIADTGPNSGYITPDIGIAANESRIFFVGLIIPDSDLLVAGVHFKLCLQVSDDGGSTFRDDGVSEFDTGAFWGSDKFGNVISPSMIPGMIVNGSEYRNKRVRFREVQNATMTVGLGYELR